MTRTTRAAARAGNIHVDEPSPATEQAQIGSPSVLKSKRVPLEEVADNDRKPLSEEVEGKATVAPNTAKAASKKCKPIKKGGKKAHKDADEPKDLENIAPENIQKDDNARIRSEHDVGTETGSSPEHKKILGDEVKIASEASNNGDDTSSDIGQLVSGTVLAESRPTQRDKETNLAKSNELPENDGPREMTPTNLNSTTTIDERSKTYQEKVHQDAMHLEKTISDQVAITEAPARIANEGPGSCSTPKRPEDSIDAIDALEDALEEIGNEVSSLSPPSKPQPSSLISTGREDATTQPMRSVASKPKQPLQTKTATLNRLSTSKPSALRHVKAISVSEVPSSKRNSVTLDTRKKTSSEAQADKLPNKPTSSSTTRRPVSLSFPAPPPPAKSTKAPTRPTFTLPGEAVAAKLKAQREERLKREEEELKSRREFKARPVRKSVTSSTVTVKPTATSRARESAANRQPSIGGEEAARTASSGTFNAGKTQSIRSNTSRPRISAAPKATAPNAPLKRQSTLSSRSSVTATASRAPSGGPLSTPAKGTVSASEIVQQRQKAREMFARDRQASADVEKAKKAKEDAARKARMEAAERGRLASREWAERQRARGAGKKSGEGRVEDGVVGKE